MIKTFTSTTAMLLAVGVAAAAPSGRTALAQNADRPSNLAAPPPGFPPYPTLPPGFANSAPVPPGTAPEAEEPPPPPEPLEDPFTRIKDLEMRLDKQQEQIANQRPRVTLGGYVDFGFFVPRGDGAGIVRDNGNAMFPQYAGQYGWVFLGDILATAVNTRGEVADLGDAAGAVRFDSIDSQGAPGFIANEINLNVSSGLTSSVLATASVNLMPRSGGNFSIGDFVDIDLAQLEWVITEGGGTSLFVGKTESLIGIEYRDRKSNSRFGITPSLLSRYTTGTALGIKLRSKLGPNDLLVLAGAVTNGSNTTEQFHFYDEIDTNAGKTASGRVALRPPFGFDLEIGFSGAFGAQDRAHNNDGRMWFWGPDLLATLGPVDIKAQFLKGKSPGRPAEDVYGLDLKGGAYLEMDWMVLPWLGVIGRGEYRDAFVWQGDPSAPEGANRAYLTKSWRGTFGTRIVFNDRIVLKAEYLRNGEYGGIPEIRNDMFTSSLVFSN